MTNLEKSFEMLEEIVLAGEMVEFDRYKSESRFNENLDILREKIKEWRYFVKKDGNDDIICFRNKDLAKNFSTKSGKEFAIFFENNCAYQIYQDGTKKLIDENVDKSKEEILNLNRELIGKRVFVTNLGGWYGTVKDVIDENHYSVIHNDGTIKTVDIYCIRSMEKQ